MAFAAFDSSHVAETEAFRKKHEEDYRSKETYETARFLYSDLKDDGTMVLDFSQAYNPPCSFNPYTTCPLPPRENRLTVPIRAGEMAYPHPPAGHR